MSIAYASGQKAKLIDMRQKLNIDEIRIRRSTELYRLRLEGWSVPELMTFFNISRSYVYQELKNVPSHVRALISGRYKND